MKRTLLAMALSAGLAFGFGGAAIADDDDNRISAGHTTFTSESEDFFVCGCPRKSVCRVHATITNFNGADPLVQIEFQDGDSVRLNVPEGTSHSLTQVMGTRNDKDVDDVVRFNPAQGASPANVIVAWVSIELLGRDSRRNGSANSLFGCTTIPYTQ